MTIQEALDRIDMIKPNMVSPEIKIAWLSELDGMLWRELVLTHERRQSMMQHDRHSDRAIIPRGGKGVRVLDGNDPLTEDINTHHNEAYSEEKKCDPDVFRGYDITTDVTTKLLVQFPYDGLYQHYLAMQIDIANAQVEKFNNDSQLFNGAYQSYSDWYTRTHRPLRNVHCFQL